jgi:hypothetical protein
MCDYSLHNVASRPAKVGDKLVTTRFMCTATRGLAAVGAPQIAVCLRPGTELSFDDPGGKPLRWWHRFNRLNLRVAAGTRAIFRKVNADNISAHHDAIEFANGRQQLLTYLADGQRVTVLQLPVQEMPTTSVGHHEAIETPAPVELEPLQM